MTVRFRVGRYGRVMMNMWRCDRAAGAVAALSIAHASGPLAVGAGVRYTAAVRERETLVEKCGAVAQGTERGFPKPNSPMCWISVLNPCGPLLTGVRIFANLGVRSGGQTCGCGACCRSFSDVLERTRAGWKSPTVMAQTSRTFTSVHRRWGQQWVKAA
jgi:hypothetical protein